MIELSTLTIISLEIEQAKRGQKISLKKKWAKVLNTSVRSIERQLQNLTSKEKQTRSDKGARKIQNIEKHVRIVWGIKMCPPGKKDVIATDQAIEIAVNNNLISTEAGQVPTSTYNRIAKDLKLFKTVKRFSRFQAKYANLLHQSDASSSKFLYVKRILPEGERILKLVHPHSDYKNKPVPVRERPWIYGIVDDYSGMTCCKYTTAIGESAADSLDFLQYAWSSDKNNDQLLFSGTPRFLYLDNGVTAKAHPAQQFFKNCGVTLITGLPYNSQARGKIESSWKTIFKSFEMILYAECGDWKSFEITLTELNRRFEIFMAKHNARQHRYTKKKTRRQMWWESINERGGIVKISRKALSTVFQKHKRTVKNGVFQLENQEYEVIGFDEGKVFVYEGVFDDRLVVQCRKTHERYQTKKFKPLSFGQRLEVEEPRANELVKDFRENTLSTKPLFDQNEQQTANLPVKVKEEVEPVDILAVPEAAIVNESNKQPDIGRPIFSNDRERYEWIRKQPKTEEKDQIFCKAFESTDLYKQLQPGYEKLDNFEKRTAI